MVVFTNGEPDNSEYRQFKIKAQYGGDCGAIREILNRRLNNQDWLLPQLILIDGGKSQVSTAYEVLLNHHYHQEIALLGLIKGKETIVVPIIDRNRLVGWKLIEKSCKTSGLLILQHARDEAHRFAQRYYRKLSKKSLFGLLGENKN